MRRTPTPARAERHPRRTRNRARILDAALAVFTRKGYHEAKMEDIARLAKVAKGTLYYNFESKAQLFSAMVTEGMERIIETVRRELDSDLHFPDHFRKLLDVNIALHRQYRDLFKVSFNKLSFGLEPEVLRRIEAVRDRYVAFIEDLLLTGQAKGYLKPIDAHLAAVAILALLDGLSNYYEKTPAPLPPEALVDHVYAFLASGLLNATPAPEPAPPIPGGDPA